MTLKDIRRRASERINRLRRVQRLIESEAFALVWGTSTDSERKEVDGWVYLGDMTRLELWLERGRTRDLEMMSLRQLRDKASSVGIPYYARLSKSELIWEINNAESGDHREDPGHENGNGAVGHQVGQNLPEEVQRQVRPA